ANLNVADWDTAFGWGNHALAGYITGFSELNDLTAAVTWANVPEANIPTHTGHVTGGTDLALVVAAITGQIALTSGLAGTDELLVSDAGVIKRMDITVLETYMEANIALPIGQVSGFTDNSTDWDTAFGWGNHAVPGYLTSIPTHTGHVTGDAGLTLVVAAITGQAELTTGLASTDEVLVSDGGVIKRMDISVLEEYLSTNLTGLTFGIQFFISTGADATYIIDQFASFAYTIVDAVAETASGTITLEVNIDTVAVTGISAMAITSTESTDTASATNAVAAGATVDFIFTANSSALGLSVKLNCTRD
ncbi:hypothetical protein LCGC14_1122850, partial [marine sediment metagenome]